MRGRTATVAELRRSSPRPAWSSPGACGVPESLLKRGSRSLTPTTPGPRSSWRLARRSLPRQRARCYPAGGPSAQAGERGAKAVWSPICPLKSYRLKKKRPYQCLRAPAVSADEWHREGGGVGPRWLPPAFPNREALGELGVPRSTYYRWLRRKEQQGLEDDIGASNRHRGTSWLPRK